MIKRVKRECPHCSELFTPKTVTSVYCTEQCSKRAYQKRKTEEKKELRRQSLIAKIPADKTFITVPEAILIFDIAKTTVYRLIKNKSVPSVNEGSRLIRVDRQALEKLFPLSTKSKTERIDANPFVYDLAKENCYTIGEIAQKFQLHDTSVYKHIRKYSIPTRQIGNYVYAPKSEIDKLYNGIIN
ncbi:helix-turn-helix domain-containing protein [Chryseobacterium sp. B21-037]|uniref:helix-turn-helix domain-containing protein n=1 Tax=Chryseobacterium sp. B21-037 TaxID=2926038 RepID=UPI0023593F6B|nr:helix-turn-helix domain-containing protein [Chryseobacterium sp. B21-037]MDC8105035.1 helix-turn-helix domain-containing protein [Chryseobacterium sp. B21-037]